MLLCQLSDQLGNQMFAYAAIKSIALDHGYKFGVNITIRQPIFEKRHR